MKVWVGDDSMGWKQYLRYFILNFACDVDASPASMVSI